MAWIKVDQTICTHKKTLKLACRLGIEISQAIGLMVTLWLWAIDNAPDGSLEGIESPLLARAIGWSGDPQKLVDAMLDAGLIDGDHLHNWGERNGKLIDQREAAKERSHKSREARMAKALSRNNVGDPASVHVAQSVRAPCAHVTAQSRVDQSRVDQSRVDTPPDPPEGDTDRAEILQGDHFNQFWSAYPKKVGKIAARKAFNKVDVPIESLLSAIERQKCSDQWSKDNGQYIPNPATWVNQGRWDDEIGKSPSIKPKENSPHNENWGWSNG